MYYENLTGLPLYVDENHKIVVSDSRPRFNAQLRQLDIFDVSKSQEAKKIPLKPLN